MKKILLVLLIAAFCVAPLTAEFGVGLGYTNLFDPADPYVGEGAHLLNTRVTGTLQVYLIDLDIIKLGGEVQLGAMTFEVLGTQYIIGELPLDVVVAMDLGGIGVQAFAGYCAEFLVIESELTYINMANAGARVVLGGLYAEVGGIFALQSLTELNVDAALNAYTLKAGIGFFF